jgi:2',3'-cyclic-nucleotide 2'-phosphodiesterase (5'-nucleotidase family)
MKQIVILGFYSFILLFTTKSFSQNTDDGKISVNLLQLNDVYEISPLNNGTEGGLARVARIRKKLADENPNTYTVLCGDFLFPSALGTIKYEGTPMYGRQMVDVLNTAGIDLVVFGNHEFDIPEKELIKRINESAFDWIGSNVRHVVKSDTVAFTKLNRFSETAIPKEKILVFKDADGTEFKIGVLGICINSNLKAYVKYDDYLISAKASIDRLKPITDIIIALTHLDLEDDKTVAKQFPELKLILGGHEHVHSYDTIGHTVIAKADANAKTVYIHKLEYDKSSKKLSIQSTLTTVNQSISDDPETQRKVDEWNGIAGRSLRQQGFDPDQILANLESPYDGREKSVRYKSTNLTRMIAKAVTSASPGTDFSVYNSGSIRLDDELQGKVTQYDIIRTLPYGGKIVSVSLKGSNIKKGLDYAVANLGNGSYPQLDRIRRDDKGNWYVNEKLLDLNKVYSMAINDYLVDVSEEFKPFFSRKAPGVLLVNDPVKEDVLRNDLRQAVINYLIQGGR